MIDLPQTLEADRRINAEQALKKVAPHPALADPFFDACLCFSTQSGRSEAGRVNRRSDVRRVVDAARPLKTRTHRIGPHARPSDRQNRQETVNRRP